eukprot:6190705-Pleurochrysis_carterae.AAC.1
MFFYCVHRVSWNQILPSQHHLVLKNLHALFKMLQSAPSAPHLRQSLAASFNLHLFTPKARPLCVAFVRCPCALDVPLA